MCSRTCSRGVVEGVAVQGDRMLCVHWLNCCWCDVMTHSNLNHNAL